MSGTENRILPSIAPSKRFDERYSFHNPEKYATQIGLKDIDFDIYPIRREIAGCKLPILTVDLAEQALADHILFPIRMVEFDNTEHNVLAFDPRPIGYSGFMNCVTHSIIMTNHGLFEVGRYPAMNPDYTKRRWQWFIHRRLATIANVNELCEDRSQSVGEFMRDTFLAFTDQ
jgi:hypothetical protein